MPVQAVVTVTNGGYRSCVVCGQYRATALIHGGLHSKEPIEKSFGLCWECIKKPGCTFTITAPTAVEMNAKVRKKINKRSRKGEEKTAAEIGGQRTLASGALNRDGDVKNSSWMVEEKATSAKSYSIKDDTVAKGIVQASRQSKSFVMKIITQKYALGLMLWNDLLPFIREDE